MNHTLNNKILAIGAVAILGFLAAIVVLSLTYARPVVASTLAYAVPKVATSSQFTVGPQAVTTIVSTMSNCTGRAIGTVGTAIQLSFSSLVPPTGTAGYPQGASTTVFYNNGDYGCGAITAYAAASTTITVTAFAQ